jgi:hypothetical protein
MSLDSYVQNSEQIEAMSLKIKEFSAGDPEAALDADSRLLQHLHGFSARPECRR